jgi:hypothetical protein
LANEMSALTEMAADAIDRLAITPAEQLHEDDWHKDALDVFDDRRQEIPLLPNCQYTFITATITVNPKHRVGWLLGDLLVRTESASGRCRERTIPIAPESVVHLGGLTHINLLDHPQAYDALLSAVATSVRAGGESRT